jgi:TonB family protein
MIQALRISSEDDKRLLAGIDFEEFDREVMARIHRRPKQLILQETSWRQYNIRMAFSFVAAAAVVLFILKSVSDLGPIDMQRAMAPTQSSGDGRRVINIQLGKEAETPFAFKDAPAKSEEREADAFSILTGPVTAPSPESVNIDAVFVATESVPIENQMEAASLAEVYTDTGAVQAMAPQVRVLITTEKMPRPIHVAVPEYPVWAQKQALSANVWVKARVNADGTVGEVIILSCDNPGVGFEESATRAALKSRFLPATSNGINFAVWVVYPVRFIFSG